MITGLVLGALFGFARLHWIEPPKRFIGRLLQSVALIVLVLAIDHGLVPYFAGGYAVALLATVLLAAAFVLICSILPEVEEL